MRISIICAVPLIGVIAACTDDPTTALVPRQPSAAVAAATDPLSKVNPLSPALEQKVQLFRGDLESNGYQVARGYFTLWSAEDCHFPIQVIGFCYGNNPTAPYVTAVVPRWENEFFDQRMHQGISEFRRNMNALYRMGEQDALVVMVEMPPPARYFGIQSNVFSRETTLNTTDPIYWIPWLDDELRGILFSDLPDPSRRMLIASIGNSTNNVVMSQQTGEPWEAGQQRFIIVTPDANMADSLTAALVRSGVPSNAIFVEKVSPDVVHIGLDRSADDLITYIRYAMPDDSVAGEEWRRRLPLTVLRVRDISGLRTENPFTVPSYDPRNFNFDETVLAEDLDSLIDAVRTYWNQPAATVKASFSAYKLLDLIGQHCLSYPNPARGPMNCLGDTQDADYQISQSFLIDSGQVIAVVGTLATETGNATYVSVSVNWFPQLVGIKNISDEDLDGSAQRFAGSLDNPARLFYVYYIARDCTGLENCVEVEKRLLPRGSTLKFIQRNYVTPGYARGPDPFKMVNPVGIILDGKNRPGAITLKGKGK